MTLVEAVACATAGLSMMATMGAVAWWHAANKRAAVARARAEHAGRLLRYIKQVHRVGDQRDEDGFWTCAECTKPHPCETFRSASGDPGWPRPADEVLAAGPGRSNTGSYSRPDRG